LDGTEMILKMTFGLADIIVWVMVVVKLASRI
jgi:hypothetical protein